MLYKLVALEHRDESEIVFPLLLVDASGKRCRHDIKCVIGPGDNLEPVLTFMLPSED